MRGLSVASMVIVLVGCTAVAPSPAPEADVPSIARFSSSVVGGALPAGWEPWTFGAFKRPTDYRLVEVDGGTVMRASAQRSASGLIHKLRCNLREFPLLSWRWKVPELIAEADNTKPHLEDSPVRVVIAFEGDPAKLPPMERLAFNKFRMFTRHELPYATLMYIWENKAPEGTIVASQHTSRIKMIVADSGPRRLGQWREQSRDVYADYKRAFGEEPPPIAWIGIMTDSDNTGATTAGYYGDIRLSRK